MHLQARQFLVQQAGGGCKGIPVELHEFIEAAGSPDRRWVWDGLGSSCVRVEEAQAPHLQQVWTG